MLEELLKHDKLGNKEELLFFLFDGLTAGKAYSLDNIKKYCLSNFFSISRSYTGILAFCQFVSFIKIVDNVALLNENTFDQARFKKASYFDQFHFYRYLMLALKEAGVLQEIFTIDNLKFSSDLAQYYVVESKFPYKYFPLRNTLLSTEFFHRDGDLANHLIIKKEFTSDFKNCVINDALYENRIEKKLNLEHLKKIQRAKEEAGNRAEDFVLAYEHKRLDGHVDIEKVKKVSDDYVSAGFDIQSFEGHDSIFVDKFIEVKSYTGEISFFWSRNEIDTARDLGNKYYLYLVDRARMDEEGYKPQQFQDPFKKIFESDIWIKETENWKITLEK